MRTLNSMINNCRTLSKEATANNLLLLSEVVYITIKLFNPKF